MSYVVWVMVGLALWHLSVYVPDRFKGGIAAACLAAVIGAVVGGFVLSGLSIPGRNELDATTALVAIPGSLLAMVALWLAGKPEDIS